MRWDCSSCGTALTIGDDKLNEEWTFCRCYHCSNYSLVRCPNTVEPVDHEPKLVLKPSPERRITPPPPPVKSGKFSDLNAQAWDVSRPEFMEKRAIATDPTKLPTTKAVAVDLSPPTDLPPLRSSVSGWLRVGVLLCIVFAVGSGLIFLDKINKFDVKKQKDSAELKLPDSVPAIEEAPHLATAAVVVQEPIPLSASAPLTVQPEPVDRGREFLFEIRLLRPKVNLRSGPGLTFRPQGFADRGVHYRVKRWKDRWFEIELPERAPSTVHPRYNTAWIRNDLVDKLVQ